MAASIEGAKEARCLLIASTVALVIVERATRRLAPLAALLRMSLVFKRTGLSSDPNEPAREVLSLVGALSAHDPRTRGHSERVRAYAEMLGAEEGGVDCSSGPTFPSERITRRAARGR